MKNVLKIGKTSNRYLIKGMIKRIFYSFSKQKMGKMSLVAKRWSTKSEILIEAKYKEQSPAIIDFHNGFSIFIRKIKFYELIIKERSRIRQINRVS